MLARRASRGARGCRRTSSSRRSRLPRLAPVPDVEEELEQLYGRPLEEFTAQRNDLAKRLRAAGQADAADEIKALRKPPVSAWAVNRLARTRPDEVARLAKAGERLVQAQTGTLAGGGPSAFAQARAEHAEAVRTLTTAAGDELEQAGRHPTQPTVERIARTLRAASLDEHARPALVAGRLQDDVEAAGFSLLEGLALPETTPRRTAPPQDERRRLAGLRARLRELQGAEREAEREAAALRRDADRARAQADDAERAAVSAEERVAAVRRAVAEAEDELDRGKRA